MADITFRNVVKTYDNNVTVVPNLNLEIADKEFVVLVGPSGCGKSTTLRMIAGLEDITDGDLFIGDRRVNDVAPKDRNIAMVFQSYALYPHMSVYKNMAFALEIAKVPKDVIDKKVREVAKILEIEQYLDRKPKALSGGQRQRVALGRAMVRDPAVFLLDEPLSNLDAKLRTEMRSQITLLHKQLQTTFVYVTHDQTEAMTMGDRIVVMKDGIIQQVDTPVNLYNKPCNKFVAGFIGTPPMNFLKGTVTLVDGAPAIDIGEYSFTVNRKELEAYAGKEVTVGIRPESFHFNADAATGASTVGGSGFMIDVTLSELLGKECNIYFKHGDADVIARAASGLGIQTGDKIRVTVDTDSVHVFDADTEEAVFIHE